MEYITLNNKVKMPLIGLGTWDLNGKECINTVKEAIHIGYRLIDTARMYGNEKEVGIAIKESGINRKELFITTKINGNSQSYQKTIEAFYSSLENLQTDYIDLLLLHEPYLKEEKMYQALEDLYHKGLVKAIGISNYHNQRYTDMLKKCHVIPAVNQVECHIFFQKWDFQKQMENDGIMLQAWAPLAQGQKSYENIDLLKNLGKKYNKSVYQIVLRFLIQRGVSVIPKSKHVNRLKENLDVFDFCLTDEEMNDLKKLDDNHTLFPWTENF